MRLIAIAAACVAAGCAVTEAPVVGMSIETPRWRTLDGAPPIVIAHRGASGHRPEHTLEAYALAIDMGADCIEPDLVFTKDGVLVARHDRYLSTTTDVAAHPEFAARRRANDDPADEPREDWWIEDFTLAEVKTLRARQPFAGRSKEFDGLYEIPTFDAIIAHANAEAEARRRPVCIYPETKHPAFFAAKGMDFAAPLLAALKRFQAGTVFIQSFEPEILKRLKGRTGAKLVQLVFEETPGAGPNIPLADIADYADGIGAAKGLILAADGRITSLIADAHAAGLFVHAWTIRDDAPNPAMTAMAARAGPGGDVEFDYVLGPIPAIGAPAAVVEELQVLYSAGVDGVFADFPDTAIAVRDALVR